MRIEIAPWRHLETSLATSESAEEEAAFIRASFVDAEPQQKRLSSRKRRSKGKEDEDDGMIEKERRRPLLTLTTSRQAITIVEDEDRPLNPLQESSLLRYRSRPGTSFLSPSKPSNGDSSTLPCIPAVYDARHHCCFAVQKKNSQLVCFFNVESTEVSFEYAISSLSILHLSRTSQSILYGTCSNGKFFMVTFKCSETGNVSSLRVHYWDSPELPDRSVHVYTSATCIPSSTTRKRKIAEQSADSTTEVLCILVDQFFHTVCGIIFLSRKYIAVNSETMLPSSMDASSSFADFCIQRALRFPDALENSKLLVSDVRMLGYVATSDVSARDSFVICYGARAATTTALSAYPLKNGKHSKTISTPSEEQCSSYFYACIPLNKNGSPLSQVRVLPSSSLHCCMISSNLLTVITQQKELHIYDVIRGGVVFRDRMPLPDQAARPLQSISLCSQFAVLYTNGSRYWVATTSIGLVAQKVPPTALSLASGLAASLSVPSLPELGINVAISRTFFRDETSCSHDFGSQQQSKLTKGKHYSLLLHFSNTTHRIYRFLR
jgi:hypothetical protein